MSKIVAIDHAVLNLRIIGSPLAAGYDRPQEQLESMSDADFNAHISTVGSAVGSHNRVEVNEVLRRKVAQGWELFQVYHLNTSFNENRAPTAASSEYIFVKYKDEGAVKAQAFLGTPIEPKKKTKKADASSN